MDYNVDEIRKNKCICVKHILKRDETDAVFSPIGKWNECIKKRIKGRPTRTRLNVMRIV